MTDVAGRIGLFSKCGLLLLLQHSAEKMQHQGRRKDLDMYCIALNLLLRHSFYG